jgi:hypothetical protein
MIGDRCPMRQVLIDASGGEVIGRGIGFSSNPISGGLRLGPLAALPSSRRDAKPFDNLVILVTSAFPDRRCAGKNSLPHLERANDRYDC